MLNRLAMCVALAALMGVTACKSDPKDNGPSSNKETTRGGPSWYMNHEGEEAGKLYGYGVSAGEKNEALAEASAKAAAREDMASTINTLIQAMFERYLASTSNTENIKEEMSSTQTLRSITDQAISGFQIKKKEYKGDYLYARGTLALDELKAMIRNSKEVNDALKEVRQNAAEAFGKMDQILEEEAKKKMGN